MLESKIKSRCKKLLTKAGWMVIHLIQTNQNGIPDTLIIHKTRGVWFIEFKRPGIDEPEELQKYRIRKLREQGMNAIVANSVEDIGHLI
jgi:predicted Rdx family selenoprotein